MAFLAMCGGYNNTASCDVSSLSTFSGLLGFIGDRDFNEDVSGWSVGTVTGMEHAFFGAAAFNININEWDVARVTDLSFAFAEAAAFNQPLGAWTTSGVTSLFYTFHQATAFNQPIGAWTTTSVTSLYSTFRHAVNFNQPLNTWDMSSVTKVGSAFAFSKFNQNLTAWALCRVATMPKYYCNADSFKLCSGSLPVGITQVFTNAAAFNGAVATWDVSSCLGRAYETFYGAGAFNQALGLWDTSRVSTMQGMFSKAVSFDRDLGRWQVSRVKNMGGMFCFAEAFNRALSGWDVSRVTDMGSMFNNAKSFDQDLSGWTLSAQLTKMFTMFFATNLGLCNKAAIRESWGDTQKNAAFLEYYGNWPQQCSVKTAPCRAWQQLGAGKNADCEPALWLDARACMANVWNGTHPVGWRAPPIAHRTQQEHAARSDWATPFLEHAPDQISIRNGACTHLPSMSEVFKRSLDIVIGRFGTHLNAKLRSLGFEELGNDANDGQHNAGDGVSALVTFQAGSSDLFVIKLMAGSKDGACTAIEFGDGTGLKTGVNIATRALSLKNVTRSGGNAAHDNNDGDDTARQCYGTQWTPSLVLLKLLDLDEIFIKSGILPDEPSFALSWLPPSRMNRPQSSPTLVCPTRASLTSPFELKGVVDPAIPGKHHAIQVCRSCFQRVEAKLRSILRAALFVLCLHCHRAKRLVDARRAQGLWGLRDHECFVFDALLCVTVSVIRVWLCYASC